ncbi:MFS transporter [Streptomyces hoynatensis]|uniref:MFS transporter n=1 Tax=Streptomyces hoynatensis TaxID=1141874 RepID=A0A3A9YLT6_9ACTN|nr:MFS transporter [Streptomyces hoynatensis]RKN37199.1 MFS transporter [Streptomyces hoynatensis]
MAQPPTSATNTARAHTGTGTIVAALAGAGITVSIMQTLVVPLIPDLPRLLGASSSGASWVITATLLTGAVATPVMGRLGDMYGKRRMLLTCLGLLVAGSLVCALSSSLAPMVAGRALQGCAMGVIPLGISIMRDELPPERMGSAMALMSSSLGIGGALGLPASAAIAQNTDWHVLFWGSAGLGVLSMTVVLLFVRESPVRAGGRFDLVGALGLSAGLVCLLLAISQGADWGWGSAVTLGLFAAAVVLLLVWGGWELRAGQPLVDLRTTARPRVLLTNLASVVLGFAMYAMSLVQPQLLQLPEETGYGLGRSMVVAGLCLAPSGLVMMLVSPVSARISARFGPKISLMSGAAVVALGYGAGIPLMDAVWQIVLVSCVIGAGIAIAYAAMPALIMSAVPQSETAAANGLNTLMRAVGISSSSAVVGVLLANMTTDFAGQALPSLNGFRTAFAIAALGSLAAVLVAAFIPAHRPERAVAARPKAQGEAVPADAEPAG